MNGIRMGGIASGMDTESIVKQLVASKRSRLDSYERRVSKNDWLVETYNEINQSLANFMLNSRKNLGLTDVDYFGNLKYNSIDKVDWVNSARSSDDKIVGAVSMSGAIPGRYSVAVKQLASSATAVGKSVKDAEITNKTRLSQLKVYNEDTHAYEQVSFDVDSKGNFTVDVNGKSIQLNSMMTVDEAIKTVKEKADINANFDDGSRMLFMSTKSTGAKKKDGDKEVDNSLKFGGDDNTKNFFASLGLKDMGEVKGKDAIISFNGSEDITYSSNEVSINGIKLSLKNISEKDSVGNFKNEYIDVSANVDGIYEKIKGFVDEYNKIIDDLQTRISQKPPKKQYHPLTKEERKELKEEEVKLWDEKAKEGLLGKDKVIRKMLSNIRTGLYEQVHSTFDPEGKNVKGEAIGYLFDIGITTGNWKDGAKLKIDEGKLKEAIAKDPQKVVNLLFQSSDDKRVNISSSDSSAVAQGKRVALNNRRAETGVFTRIMDSINAGMEEIVKHSGIGKSPELLSQVNNNIFMSFKTKQGSISVLNKENNSINKLMEMEIKKLNRYEDMLWKKFTAMEVAISKAQDQSGWLTQQFGM